MWRRLRPVRPFRPETPKLEAGGKPVPVPWRRRLAGWLERVFTRAPSLAVDFHCVEFNAWVYSGSENLWAGLITHLPDGLSEIYMHPATGPYPGSAPGYQYEGELAALTDLRMPALLAAGGIRTGGFADFPAQ